MIKNSILFLLVLFSFSSVFAVSKFSNVENIIDTMDLSSDDKEYYKQTLRDYLTDTTKEMLAEKIEESSFRYLEKKTGKLLDFGITGKIFLIGDAIDWVNAYNEWEKNPTWENDQILSEKAMGFYSNFLGPGGLLIDGTILIMSTEREKIIDRQFVMDLMDKALREQEDKSMPLTLFTSASGNAQMIFGTKSVQNGDSSWSTEIGDDLTPRWGLLRYLNNEQIEELAAYLQLNPNPSINAYNSPAFLRFMKGGGPAMFQKHSPVYMTITDPDGIIYGINPETKELMCTNDWICPALQNASDANQLIIPSIMNGTYAVRLYGFNDGNYSFEFIGFNSSYNLQGIVKKTGYINKGEVLESVFEIQLTDNGYLISDSSFVKINETFIIPLNPEIMPLKIISYFPFNNSTSYEAKPLITVNFNLPIEAKQALTDNNGAIIDCFASVTNYNKTLQLLPLAPLSTGTYIINLESYGINETISFSINNPYSSMVKYKLSNPVIRNVTKYFRITNNYSGTASFSVDFSAFKTITPYLFSKVIGFSRAPDYNLTDSLGNNHYKWDVTLAPWESAIISADFVILSFDADFLSYMDLSKQQTESSLEFGAGGNCINFTDPNIKSLALEITANDRTALEKALRISEWVRDNIDYDYILVQNEGASETLENREGICHGYACLAASLLRNAGIPARYVAGESMGEDINISLAALHAWNEIYVNGLGWLPIDTTWARTLGDYFLKISNSHAAYMYLNGWPSDDLLNWHDAPWNLNSSFTASYAALSNSSCLEAEVKTLYDSVSALDFLDSFRRHYLWNNSMRGWTFLGNHLSSPSDAMILMQEKIDDYNAGLGLDCSDATGMVYSGFIDSLKSLKDYYYDYLNDSYNSCALARDNCIDFNNHSDYFNNSITVGELFGDTSALLESAKASLADNDYETVKDLINSSANNIYSISYDSGTISYSVYEMPYLDNAGLAWAFMILYPLIFWLFPFATFVHCIFKKSFKHHGRFSYILIIFFLNAPGAVYYWIRER
jgi:hypothetical protein